jgi:hypothetical protein
MPFACACLLTRLCAPFTLYANRFRPALSLAPSQTSRHRPIACHPGQPVRRHRKFRYSADGSRSIRTSLERTPGPPTAHANETCAKTHRRSVVLSEQAGRFRQDSRSRPDPRHATRKFEFGSGVDIRSTSKSGIAHKSAGSWSRCNLAATNRPKSVQPDHPNARLLPLSPSSRGAHSLLVVGQVKHAFSWAGWRFGRLVPLFEGGPI